MPACARVGDIGKCQSDAHGCPSCPHPVQGPAIIGSTSVFINSRPSVRQDDIGIHAVCCGPNMWKATAGSGSVFVNGKAIHRKGDAQQHCGGSGKMDTASGDVNAGG